VNPKTQPNGLTLLRLITLNLWDRKVQTLITVIGVVVALGAGISAVGFSESVSRSISSSALPRDIEMLVLQADKPNPVTSRLDTHAAREVARLPGIISTHLLLVDFLTLNEGQIVIVYGMQHDEPELQQLVNGRSVPLERGEVLIGKAAAAVGNIAVGDRIDLNLGSFRVAGFFENKSFMESGIVYMRLDDLQRLTDAMSSANFFLINIDDRLDAKERESLRRAIEATVPEGRVLSTDEFFGEDKMLKLVDGLARTIFGTTTLLGALLVSTIMLLTVNERRREIAILRAIGWSPSRISSLLFLETGAVVLTGAIGGLAIGWMGLQFALKYIQQIGIYAEGAFTVTIVSLAALGAFGVTLLGTVPPVFHALKIRVAEAVKYT
jgi:putative ABC transport system permease protein